QSTELRECHRDHKGGRRIDHFSLSPRNLLLTFCCTAYVGFSPKRTFDDVSRLSACGGKATWSAQKFGNHCCGSACVGDEKQMAVVDAHQARVGNEACQDTTVGERHKRVVGPGHDQRRLCKQTQPRQARPATASE